jgi:hypothetical protein
MGATIGQLVVDCADPAALGRWWAEVLGWHVEDDDEGDTWVSPAAGGVQGLLFQAVPERKTVKNRLHLDVRPSDGSDQASELRRLLDLGATPVDIGQGDVPWHVLADPEGNEFCLLRSTLTQLRERLAAEAAGQQG